MIVDWHTSSWDLQEEGAVESAVDDQHNVHLRKKGDPEGTELIFTPDEWDAFCAGVMLGEFDIPNLLPPG